jgi:hypothetical protein
MAVVITIGQVWIGFTKAALADPVLVEGSTRSSYLRAVRQAGRYLIPVALGAIGLAFWADQRPTALLLYFSYAVWGLSNPGLAACIKRMRLGLTLGAEFGVLLALAGAFALNVGSPIGRVTFVSLFLVGRLLVLGAASLSEERAHREIRIRELVGDLTTSRSGGFVLDFLIQALAGRAWQFLLLFVGGTDVFGQMKAVQLLIAPALLLSNGAKGPLLAMVARRHSTSRDTIAIVAGSAVVSMTVVAVFSVGMILLSTASPQVGGMEDVPLLLFLLAGLGAIAQASIDGPFLAVKSTGTAPALVRLRSEISAVILVFGILGAVQGTAEAGLLGGGLGRLVASGWTWRKYILLRSRQRYDLASTSVATASSA